MTKTALGSGILSTQLGSCILILSLSACTPPDPKDSARPDSADTAVHTGDTQDSATDCVSYADLVAQCAARVVPGERVEGYETIDPASATLADDLHALISATHDGVSYDNLWEAFPSTDARDDGTVWDIYTDPGEGAPVVVFEFSVDQCGEYDGEGVCYNREHLWAQNWTNGGSPMKSDLHHVFPTDGWVNNLRGDLNFGPVSEPDATTTNGSTRGESALCDYDGDVYEPVDAYKGDVARAMLYMTVRYRGEDAGWGSSDGTTKSELAPWFRELVIAWHLQDPPSEKEYARNAAVERIQGNRNPFVDHPEYACNAL